MNLPLYRVDDKPLTIEDFEPYKIVSLWDMLQFYAWKFVKTVEFLNTLATMYEQSKSKRSMKPLLMGTRDGIKELHDILIGMEAVNSALRVERLLQALDDDHKWGEPAWANEINEIIQTILDDLNTKAIYMVPYSKVAEFNDPTKCFPLALRERFRIAEKDMDEACSCFALGKHTACIFHLMRVMEVPVQRLGRKFGIGPLHKKTWGKILSELSDKVSKMPEKTLQQKRSKARYNRYYSSLDAICRGIRNPIAHPMTYVYTYYDEQEAKKTIQQVRDFLENFANRR